MMSVRLVCSDVLKTSKKISQPGCHMAFRRTSLCSPAIRTCHMPNVCQNRKHMQHVSCFLQPAASVCVHFPKNAKRASDLNQTPLSSFVWNYHNSLSQNMQVFFENFIKKISVVLHCLYRLPGFESPSQSNRLHFPVFHRNSVVSHQNVDSCTGYPPSYPQSCG